MAESADSAYPDLNALNALIMIGFIIKYIDFLILFEEYVIN